MEFKSKDSLDIHIQGCVYAKVLFFHLAAKAVYHWSNGHCEEQRKAAAIHRNKELIEKYVRSVVFQTPSVQRAVWHQELCEKMYVDYTSFKPFENEEIKETPTFSDALERFLWAYFYEPMVSGKRNKTNPST
jgi:hypothetical protein